MFRKKPNIPPRPLPPSAEQIEEDLEKVRDDDVVFTLFEQVKDRFNSGSINKEITDTQIQSVDADTVYSQVKSLMEANKKLKELLVVLTDKNTALQDSRSGLQSMADEIRQQSMDALK